MNKDERTKKQQGVMSGILKMGASMAGFAIGDNLFRKGVNVLSRKVFAPMLGKAAKRLPRMAMSKHSAPIRRVTTRSRAGAGGRRRVRMDRIVRRESKRYASNKTMTGRAYNHVQKGVNKVAPILHKKIRKMGNRYNRIVSQNKDAKPSVGELFKETRKKGSFSRRMDSSEKKYFIDKKKPISRAGRREKVKAGLYREAKQTAMTAPMFYAADKILHPVNEETGRKWYNPKEMLSWSKGHAISSFGMRGLSPIGGAIGSSGAMNSAIRKLKMTNNGGMSKALESVIRKSGGGAASLHASAQSITNLKASNKTAAGGGVRNKLNNMVKTASGFIDNFSKDYQNNMAIQGVDVSANRVKRREWQSSLIKRATEGTGIIKSSARVLGLDTMAQNVVNRTTSTRNVGIQIIAKNEGNNIDLLKKGVDKLLPGDFSVSARKGRSAAAKIIIDDANKNDPSESGAVKFLNRFLPEKRKLGAQRVSATAELGYSRKDVRLFKQGKLHTSQEIEARGRAHVKPGAHIKSGAIDLDPNMIKGSRIYRGQGMLTMGGDNIDLSAFSGKRIGQSMLSLARNTIAPLGHAMSELMNIGPSIDLLSSSSKIEIYGKGTNIALGRSYKDKSIFGGIGSMMKKVGDNQSTQDDYFGNKERRGADFMRHRRKNSKSSDAFAQSVKETGLEGEHGGLILQDGEQAVMIGERLYLTQSTKHSTEAKNQALITIDNNLQKVNDGLRDNTGVERANLNRRRKTLEKRKAIIKSTEMNDSDVWALGVSKHGNAMKYKKMGSNAKGIFTHVHDQYMGGRFVNENTELQSNAGNDSEFSESIKHYGYGGSTPRVDYDNDTIMGRASKRFLHKYDIGGKKNSSIFGAIGSWYKSFTNPADMQNIMDPTIRETKVVKNFFQRGDSNEIEEMGKTIGRNIDDMYSKAFSDTFNNDAKIIKFNEMHNTQLKTISDVSQEFAANGKVESMPDIIMKDNINELSHISRNIGGTKVSNINEHNKEVLRKYYINKSSSEVKTSMKRTDMFSDYDTERLMFMSDFSEEGISSYRNMPLINKEASSTVNARGHNVLGTEIDYLLNRLSPHSKVTKSYFGKTTPIWKRGHGSTSYTQPQHRGTREGFFIAQSMDAMGKNINEGTNSFFPTLSKSADGIELADSTLTLKSYLVGGAIESVNNIANAVGVGFSSANMRTPQAFLKNMVLKRALPLAGILGAWQIGDALVDESGLFEDTALEEGINVFAASQVVKGRLAAANVMDLSGLTGIAKWAEDTMPGSINSPLMAGIRGIGSPLAAAKIGLSMAGPQGGLIGGIAGGLFGLMSAGGPLGMTGSYDMTKSHDELVEEYSGRKKVALVDDKGWLLGSTPMAGTNVDGYVQNWYSRMRTGAKHTPTLYGDKMGQLYNKFGLKNLEESNYESRPYPEKAGMFANLPLIGGVVKLPSHRQHGNELNEYMNLPGVGNSDGYAIGGGPGGVMESMDYINNELDYSVGTGKGDMLTQSSGSAKNRVGAALYGATELAGLRGFSAQMMYQSVTGENAPGELDEQWANSGVMDNKGRSYWDQSIGDPLFFTEFLRRLYPQDYNKSSSTNPLGNLMGNWMPDKYQTGDPYTSIKFGEARLAGAGYEAANNVDLTFPGDTSIYDADPTKMAGYYLYGKKEDAADIEMKNRTKAMILKQLALHGNMAQTDKGLYSAQQDLSGVADILTGSKVYNIKSVGDDEFQQINGIGESEYEKGNILAGLAKKQAGEVVYVSTETGETKSFNFQASEQTYLAASQKINIARNEARIAMDNAPNDASFNLSNAYSRLDRLKILSDVAPNTKAYHETLTQVQKESMIRPFNEQQQIDLENSMRMSFTRAQPKNLYPYRFKNMGISSEDDTARTDAIHEEYNFFERSVGSAWETVSHQQTLINSKLMDINSPYEGYSRGQVFGKQVKLWDNPVDDYMKPYMATAMNSESPTHNVMAGGTFGFIMGGQMGALAGGVGLGAIGLKNSITGRPNDVPEYRQEQRDMNITLDQLEYDRQMNAYNATGNSVYLQKAKYTAAYGLDNMGDMDLQQLTKGASFNEKRYLSALSQTGNAEERNRILQELPDNLAPGMRKIWNNGPIDYNHSDRVNELLQNTPDQWAGNFAEQNINLIKTKVFENEALDAKSVGTGWNRDRIELQKKTGIVGSLSETMNIDTTEIRQTLQRSLSSIGSIHVSVSPTMGEGNNVQINILN